MDLEKLRIQAEGLTESDIAERVDRLSSKLDDVRYPAFLLLQLRSQTHPDVYPQWVRFLPLLQEKSTYFQHIGLWLLAENVRWDDAKQFNAIVDEYLSRCADRKFLVARKAIQGVGIWLPFRLDLRDKVDTAFSQVALHGYKDSQRGLLLWDMVEVLLAAPPTDAGNALLLSAATGSLLDKKRREQLCAHLGM